MLFKSSQDQLSKRYTDSDFCVSFGKHHDGYDESPGRRCMSLKKPENALLIYLPADHVNGMMAVFDLLIRTNPENELSGEAAGLKKKIIEHGRTFQSQGADSVSIMFFETELCSLIRILALFSFVVQENSCDYFPKIGRVKKTRSDAKV